MTGEELLKVPDDPTDTRPHVQQLRERLRRATAMVEAIRRTRDAAHERLKAEHAQCASRRAKSDDERSAQHADFARQLHEAEKTVARLHEEAHVAHLNLTDTRNAHEVLKRAVERDEEAHRLALQAWRDEKEALLLRLATLAEKLDAALQRGEGTPTRVETPRTADPTDFKVHR